MMNTDSFQPEAQNMTKPISGINKYKKGDELGAGTYGVVFKA